MKAIRTFEAINHGTGTTATATIYEREDGSFVAYEDADTGFNSPLGTATAEQGAEALENSLS